MVADLHHPALRVEADHVADEEVAARRLADQLVDDRADVQAAAAQRALDQLLLVRIGLLEQRLQLRQRRLAGQLLDDVCVRLGDDERPPHRPAPLRDDMAHADPAQHDADRALLAHVVVMEQHVAAGAAPAAGHAAQHRHARHPLLELLQEQVGREGVGLAEQEQRHRTAALGRRADAGEAAHVDRLVVLLDVERERLDLAFREMGEPDRDARTVLDFAAVADDGVAAAADQREGAGARAHQPGDAIETGVVLVRHEQQGEARSFAAAAQRLGARLLHGDLEIRIGRAPCAEPVHDRSARKSARRVRRTWRPAARSGRSVAPRASVRRRRAPQKMLNSSPALAA